MLVMDMSRWHHTRLSPCRTILLRWEASLATSEEVCRSDRQIQRLPFRIILVVRLESSRATQQGILTLEISDVGHRRHNHLLRAISLSPTRMAVRLVAR